MNTTSSSPAPLPGSREKILARVREALQLSAPPRHLGHDHTPTTASSPVGQPGDHSEQWLPPVTEDREGQIELFARLSANLQTEFVRLPDVTAARTWMAERQTTEGWNRLASHRHPLMDRLWASAPPAGLLLTDGGYDKMELEQCDAGITACEALVVQTGTIVVTPQSSGGRVLSVLPPHHIVVATENQICRDLKVALQRVRLQHHDQLPRYISFITGPSRTGDIERILVLGAHGPRKLTVLLLSA